jgi:hypothetical protein
MLRRSYTEIKITLNEEVSEMNHRRSLTTSIPPPNSAHPPPIKSTNRDIPESG